jgi:phenylacetate-CoA ligase
LESALSDPIVERLIRDFRERLGITVEVSVEYVAHIPPEANGKHRHVICRVNTPTEPLDNN